MMIETVTLLPALLAGFLLGAIFFGGLWWTVRNGLSSAHPAMWFLLSLLLRMSITMTGFWLVANGHWERLLVCLLGFVMARHVVARLSRVPTDRPFHPSQETGHAT